jgi:hypothetical protein
MRKIMAILGLLAALTFVNTGSAEAASNGVHTQKFSCTNGSGTFNFFATYETYYIGDPTVNQTFLTDVSWYTSPLFDADRISFYGLNTNPGGEDEKLYEYGGSTGSYNDVPNSHTTNNMLRLYQFDNGYQGQMELHVWGGPSNNHSYCHDVSNLL